MHLPFCSPKQQTTNPELRMMVRLNKNTLANVFSGSSSLSWRIYNLFSTLKAIPWRLWMKTGFIIIIIYFFSIIVIIIILYRKVGISLLLQLVPSVTVLPGDTWHFKRVFCFRAICKETCQSRRVEKGFALLIRVFVFFNGTGHVKETQTISCKVSQVESPLKLWSYLQSDF